MATLPNSLALDTIVDGSLVVASQPRNNFSAVQTQANALLAILGAGTNLQVLQSGGGTTVNWGGAYSLYTPTWTAAGTPPAIGNAVVVAQYLQLGKMVHAYGRITFGSTSTFGTGFYSFALPVTASANALAARSAGSGLGFDASAGNGAQPDVLVSTTTTMTFDLPTTYLGTSNAIAAPFPWTWAQSDILSWNITYEAA